MSEVRDELTPAQQFDYFGGLCAGYSIATGADLWACTDGPSLFIDRPTKGTRSRRIARRGLVTASDVNAAFIALIDGLEYWPKAEPLGDLPPDAEWSRA